MISFVLNKLNHESYKIRLIVNRSDYGASEIPNLNKEQFTAGENNIISFFNSVRQSV